MSKTIFELLDSHRKECGIKNVLAMMFLNFDEVMTYIAQLEEKEIGYVLTVNKGTFNNRDEEVRVYRLEVIEWQKQ